MKRIALMLSAVTLLAGCATAPRSQVEEGHVWRNENGVEVISHGAQCHQVIRLDPQSNANEWVKIPCTPVAITHDPADEEFWTFTAHPEQKIQMTVMYGLVPVGPPIPAGRYPVNVRVVGLEAACEAVRASTARGRPVNDMESGMPGVPTESCLGPDYFKRGQASQ